MVVDIYATMLRPVGDDEYVVLVSAFAVDGEARPDAFPHLSAPVSDLEEARQRRQSLIDQLREDLHRRGIRVRNVREKG